MSAALKVTCKSSSYSRAVSCREGAPILTIYSPDLLTTQNEFVDVLKMRDEAKQKGNKPVLEST